MKPDLAADPGPPATGLPRKRAPRSAIESTPLVAICVALFLSALPLTDQVPAWTVALFGCALLIRLWVNWRGLRLPSLVTKIILLIGGVTAVGFSYNSVVGIEPGLGILLFLLSLKILETNTARDFQVLAILGWFLSLCGLFFNQELRNWLYVGALCLLLNAALIRFHRGAGKRSALQAIRLSITLVLQALPLMIVLFLFFPRTYGGFRFTFSRTISNSSGMSDRIEPGSVSALALNSAPAFRVEFPDQNRPIGNELYWRGGVLWDGDGLIWQRGNLQRKEPALQPTGARIRQQVILEPHGKRWIFALDQPLAPGPKMSMEPGNYLQSLKPVTNSIRYEVTSARERIRAPLLPEHRVQALQKPRSISPKIQALVDSWRFDSPGDQTVIQRALGFFANEGFAYSLEPGQYLDQSLDQFLFERRTGFCEHYAAAFASLMRLAGLPARVVIGYHGGEFNPLGNYLIVRQSDAHAWCEVWLEEIGWLRIDPVDAIAPERVQAGTPRQGLNSEFNATNNPDSTALGTRQVLRQIRLLWDNLNYQWGIRILNFDEENQRSLFTSLGLNFEDWPTVLGWALAGCGGIITLLVLWQHRRSAVPLDPIKREYLRFCRHLNAAGLVPLIHEGPLQLELRAARAFPNHADAIHQITLLYIQERYGSLPCLAHSLKDAVQSFCQVPLPKIIPNSPLTPALTPST